MTPQEIVIKLLDRQIENTTYRAKAAADSAKVWANRLRQKTAHASPFFMKQWMHRSRASAIVANRELKEFQIAREAMVELFKEWEG